MYVSKIFESLKRRSVEIHGLSEVLLDRGAVVMIIKMGSVVRAHMTKSSILVMSCINVGVSILLHFELMLDHSFFICVSSSRVVMSTEV